MPVPAPNLYPAFNTIRLSHACLNVADLSVSKKFYTEILGLQVTDESDTHIYLRAMEERGHHCLILQKSDNPGTVEVMGFKTYDEEDLDKAATYFESKKRPVQWVERAIKVERYSHLTISVFRLSFITRWIDSNRFTNNISCIVG